MSQPIRYCCRDCGYSTVPSTMGTPYTICPHCGGPWGPAIQALQLDPTPQSPPSTPARPAHDVPESLYGNPQ